eukprot:GHVH01000632.1.p1 GENE.GHVH01000632.1~~GHVH01000632.1.p1  ORF type:complete len:1456 (-),score=262.17 GHVH01000632.1:239-4606(-)
MDPPPLSVPLNRLVRRRVGTLLTSLGKHRVFEPFSHPVDPVALDCPDYFEVIRHPMDLQTIRARLDKGDEGYATLKDVHIDFTRIFRNCRTYNQANPVMLSICEKACALYLKEWKSSGFPPPPENLEAGSATIPTDEQERASDEVGAGLRPPKLKLASLPQSSEEDLTRVKEDEEPGGVDEDTQLLVDKSSRVHRRKPNTESVRIRIKHRSTESESVSESSNRSLARRPDKCAEVHPRTGRSRGVPPPPPVSVTSSSESNRPARLSRTPPQAVRRPPAAAGEDSLPAPSSPRRLRERLGGRGRVPRVSAAVLSVANRRKKEEGVRAVPYDSTHSVPPACTSPPAAPVIHPLSSPHKVKIPRRRVLATPPSGPSPEESSAAPLPPLEGDVSSLGSLSSSSKGDIRSAQEDLGSTIKKKRVTTNTGAPLAPSPPYPEAPPPHPLAAGFNGLETPRKPSRIPLAGPVDGDCEDSPITPVPNSEEVTQTDAPQTPPRSLSEEDVSPITPCVKPKSQITKQDVEGEETVVLSLEIPSTKVPGGTVKESAGESSETHPAQRSTPRQRSEVETMLKKRRVEEGRRLRLEEAQLKSEKRVDLKKRRDLLRAKKRNQVASDLSHSNNTSIVSQTSISSVAPRPAQPAEPSNAPLHEEKRRNPPKDLAGAPPRRPGGADVDSCSSVSVRSSRLAPPQSSAAPSVSSSAVDRVDENSSSVNAIDEGESTHGEDVAEETPSRPPSARRGPNSTPTNRIKKKTNRRRKQPAGIASQSSPNVDVMISEPRARSSGRRKRVAVEPLATLKTEASVVVSQHKVKRVKSTDDPANDPPSTSAMGEEGEIYEFSDTGVAATTTRAGSAPDSSQPERLTYIRSLLSEGRTRSKRETGILDGEDASSGASKQAAKGESTSAKVACLRPVKCATTAACSEVQLRHSSAVDSVINSVPTPQLLSPDDSSKSSKSAEAERSPAGAERSASSSVSSALPPSLVVDRAIYQSNQTAATTTQKHFNPIKLAIKRPSLELNRVPQPKAADEASHPEEDAPALEEPPSAPSSRKRGRREERRYPSLLMQPSRRGEATDESSEGHSRSVPHVRPENCIRLADAMPNPLQPPHPGAPRVKPCRKGVPLSTFTLMNKMAPFEYRSSLSAVSDIPKIARSRQSTEGVPPTSPPSPSHAAAEDVVDEALLGIDPARQLSDDSPPSPCARNIGIKYNVAIGVSGVLLHSTVEQYLMKHKRQARSGVPRRRSITSPSRRCLRRCEEAHSDVPRSRIVLRSDYLTRNGFEFTKSARDWLNHNRTQQPPGDVSDAEVNQRHVQYMPAVWLLGRNYKLTPDLERGIWSKMITEKRGLASESKFPGKMDSVGGTQQSSIDLCIYITSRLFQISMVCNPTPTVANHCPSDTDDIIDDTLHRNMNYDGAVEAGPVADLDFVTSGQSSDNGDSIIPKEQEDISRPVVPGRILAIHDS